MGHIDNIVDVVIYTVGIEDTVSKEVEQLLRNRVEDYSKNLLVTYTAFIEENPASTFQQCLNEYIQKHIS